MCVACSSSNIKYVCTLKKCNHHNNVGVTFHFFFEHWKSLYPSRLLVVDAIELGIVNDMELGVVHDIELGIVDGMELYCVLIDHISNIISRRNGTCYSPIDCVNILIRFRSYFKQNISIPIHFKESSNHNVTLL